MPAADTAGADIIPPGSMNQTSPFATTPQSIMRCNKPFGAIGERGRKPTEKAADTTLSTGCRHPCRRAIPARHVKEIAMKNSVVWSEIAVSDLRRATAFYEKLLDSKLKPETFGPYQIALFPHADDGVGGCLMKGEGYEPSVKGTVTYLAAKPGIDAALERAWSAGAKVLMPKTDRKSVV